MWWQALRSLTPLRSVPSLPEQPALPSLFLVRKRAAEPLWDLRSLLVLQTLPLCVSQPTPLPVLPGQRSYLRKWTEPLTGSSPARKNIKMDRDCKPGASRLSGLLCPGCFERSLNALSPGPPASLFLFVRRPPYHSSGTFL